jgi:hypothetical protein
MDRRWPPARTSRVVVGDMTAETWCPVAACAAAGCHQHRLHSLTFEDKVDAFAHLGVRSALCVRRGSRGTGRTVRTSRPSGGHLGVRSRRSSFNESDEPDRSHTGLCELSRARSTGAPSAEPWSWTDSAPGRSRARCLGLHRQKVQRSWRTDWCARLTPTTI